MAASNFVRGMIHSPYNLVLGYGNSPFEKIPGARQDSSIEDIAAMARVVHRTDGHPPEIVLPKDRESITSRVLVDGSPEWLTEAEKVRSLAVMHAMMRGRIEVCTHTLRDRGVTIIKRHSSRADIAKTVIASSHNLTPKVYFVIHGIKEHFVVEKKHGVDLIHHVNSRRLSFEDKLLLASKLATRVSLCHRILGPHCDIKPDNAVYSETTGELLLIDFQEKGKIFTPDYLSPERARYIADKTTPFSDSDLLADDVYATALSICSILSGYFPCSSYSKEHFDTEEFLRLARERACSSSVIHNLHTLFQRTKSIPSEYRVKIPSLLEKAFLTSEEGRISSSQLAKELEELTKKAD